MNTADTQACITQANMLLLTKGNVFKAMTLLVVTDYSVLLTGKHKNSCFMTTHNKMLNTQISHQGFGAGMNITVDFTVPLPFSCILKKCVSETWGTSQVAQQHYVSIVCGASITQKDWTL